MTQNILNNNAKRAIPEAGKTDPSYGKSKRVRAEQRIDDIKRDMGELDRKPSSSSSDIMHMLLLLQKDSDRRAERKELREMERRERAEREQHAKLNWRTQKSKILKTSKQPENSVKNNVARRQLVRPDSTWIVKKASAASKNDWPLIAKKQGNAMTK
ncbi:hypothetical protein PI124_g5027 [Phytophthora idaei]|nr:hypothetical protein PI125_g4624 [Phytophthora idaei]KAG3133645.1 hypothetical protein PI126_g19075 [Phytophthora idaei]KAG3250323.1 hypothetical protein PI124_g5027 [Phytophthora idaei]